MARGVRRELWDRLDNESAKAYEHFKCYLFMPPDRRTIIDAYREYSDNPYAKSTPPNWESEKTEFAWEDRARAYDAHLDRIRRKSIEDAIALEAKKAASHSEKVRGRLFELLTVQYEEAIKWLEEVGFQGMRAADVVNITRLHLEHMDKLGAGDTSATADDDWDEDDDEFTTEVLAEIEARRTGDSSEEVQPYPEEEGV